MTLCYINIKLNFCRAMFGVNHPVYLKALLRYVHHVNEFKQDPEITKIAEVWFFN